MPPVPPTIDYKKVKKLLISTYAREKINHDNKRSLALQKIVHDSQLPVVSSIHSMANCIERYRDTNALDIALDTIDLEKIYGNLEKREKRTLIQSWIMMIYLFLNYYIISRMISLVG